MFRTRDEIARAAADTLEQRTAAGVTKAALIGFDGFIDAIIDVVGTRTSMRAGDYTRIPTIAEFAARAAAAAGRSANLEMVVKEERFGGNGPLMAGAMGRLGAAVTYVGAVGREEDPRVLHPLYEELARRCAQVVPVAPPARTDALEFEDGKIMLGKPANLQGVTWGMLGNALGPDRLGAMIERADVIGVVNWVMMGGVEGIWRGLREDVLPRLVGPGGRQRRVFIDLCDPAKRTDGDVARALGALAEMNRVAPVTLGLNLAEAERIAAVLGVARAGENGMMTRGEVLAVSASRIRERAGLDTVIVHPREGAAAADGRSSAWFEGPFTASPALSTGAGDHFNGGFAFAQAHGLPLEECLATGCAVSGAYVRDAVSPDLTRLVAFLRRLPEPERA